MSHYSRLEKIVIDATDDDHDRELAFWQAALGTPLSRSQRFPEYHWADLPGQQVGLLVQRLGTGSPRVHLDIHTDDLEAEVSRLEGLGARRVITANGWWIMEDPAGLPFCVIPEPAGGLTDDNAHRWDS
jgi:hypothetical protein